MKKEYKITVDEFWASPNNAIHCKNKKEFGFAMKIFNIMNKRWNCGLKYHENEASDYSHFMATCLGSDGKYGLKIDYKRDHANIYEFAEVDFSKYISKEDELTF